MEAPNSWAGSAWARRQGKKWLVSIGFKLVPEASRNRANFAARRSGFLALAGGLGLLGAAWKPLRTPALNWFVN